MKRIIEGKRYNTEAPRTELVGYHNNRKDYQDFSYWEAGLYKTGGGRYFLAEGRAYVSFWQTVFRWDQDLWG
jgi:hypothetical protein